MILNREHLRATLAKSLQVYVVTDERTDGVSLLKILADAIAGGATTVQLRRKQALGRDFVALSRALRTLTQEAGVQFIVNDRLDVAILSDADGVHIGQDDIGCLDARRLLPDKWIGVSASTIEEAKAAERDGADYLGVGAVYPTSTKADANDCGGIDGLRAICAAVQIPVVGIGGITSENAAPLLTAGACGVAVVSAVMSAQNPRLAASKFQFLHS